MASANLDLVRSIYAASGRGDWWSPSEWAHPDIEVVWADGPEPGSWRGWTGLEELWRGWLSVWKDLRIEGEGYRELDSQRVLVLTRLSGSGTASRLEVGQFLTKGAALCHIRGGKVTRLVLYVDRERALADLGLAR